MIALAFESPIVETSTNDLARLALTTLNDPRGWPRAGFSFVDDPTSELRVLLAEPVETDQLCRPLRTGPDPTPRNQDIE